LTSSAAIDISLAFAKTQSTASAHTNYLINFLKNPATQLQFIAVELKYLTASPNSVKGLHHHLNP